MPDELEILQTCLRRWRQEMCLDDLKTTLKLEMLRSRSPEMALKELHLRLIGHNLIRCAMAQAADPCHNCLATSLCSCLPYAAPDVTVPP